MAGSALLVAHFAGDQCRQKRNMIGQNTKLTQFTRRGDLVDFLFEKQPARGYDSQFNLVCHFLSTAKACSEIERLERFELFERSATIRSSRSNRSKVQAVN